MALHPGDRLDFDRDIEQIGRVRLHQGEADSPVATLDIAKHELRRIRAFEPLPEEGVERTPRSALEGVAQIAPGSDMKAPIHPEALESSTKCFGTDLVAQHE